jgi:hypothetical protein
VVVRIFALALSIFLFGVLASRAQVETFKLNNGQEITGEILPDSANDQGVQLKVGEGKYERILWPNLNQDDLRRLAENPRYRQFAEPFIEISQEERIKATAVPIREPERLKLPERQSLFAAMLSSSVGIFLLVVLWAATIYAGYEVALFRAQPTGLVAGLSAIPFVGALAPIVFLSLPTRLPKAEPPAPEAAPVPIHHAEAEVNPMRAEGAGHPSSLHLAHEEKKEATLPPPVVFQRGQFTFNRRFFETKFANFFGVVRRETDKDMLMIVKSARGEYVAERVSRIAANDVHLQVRKGSASEEVMVPFVEIQEIRLQHKDSK